MVLPKLILKLYHSFPPLDQTKALQHLGLTLINGTTE